MKLFVFILVTILFVGYSPDIKFGEPGHRTVHYQFLNE